MAVFQWPGNWDPLAGLRLMQRELDRLGNRSSIGESRSIGGGAYPPVNVLNGPGEIVVEFEVPGVQREQIDLSITGETLTIQGVKEPVGDPKEVRFHRRERGLGDFKRTIVLPEEVDPEKITAKLTSGVLAVRLPKNQDHQPRKIAVD